MSVDLKGNRLEIIDSHIHPPFRGGVNYSIFPGLTHPVEPEAFIAPLKRTGITRCCGAVIYRPDFEGFNRVASMNQSALEFRHHVGDFYLPGIQLDAYYPEKSCVELEYNHRVEGVRWIGEMFSRSLKEDILLSSEAFQIYDLAQTFEVPISLFMVRWDLVEDICKRFEGLNIILSHPAVEISRLEACLELVQRNRNLYLDLTPSLANRFGLIKRVVEEIGSHKLIFGSGYPYRSPAAAVACYLESGLTDTQLESIFSLNFRRVTGLV